MIFTDANIADPLRAMLIRASDSLDLLAVEYGSFAQGSRNLSQESAFRVSWMLSRKSSTL
jgi:hypothetical protein